jgi:hypothetical protein
MRKLLVPLFLLLGTACWAQERIPIILDTDIGDDIDDALALASRCSIPCAPPARGNLKCSRMRIRFPRPRTAAPPDSSSIY